LAHNDNMEIIYIVGQDISLGIKLNRSPVPPDHLNLDWTPESLQAIAQVATEIFNISCLKLIAWPQGFFLAIKIVNSAAQQATAEKSFLNRTLINISSFQYY